MIKSQLWQRCLVYSWGNLLSWAIFQRPFVFGSSFCPSSEDVRYCCCRFLWCVVHLL